MVRKGQAWSFDLIAAIVIFFLIFIFLINKVDLFEENKVEELQESAKFATLQFQKEGFLQFLDSGTVNEEQLNLLVGRFLNEPGFYESTKAALEFRDVDYCFYFEDQEGNLVLINNSLVGIGSDELDIGGYSCGTTMN